VCVSVSASRSRSWAFQGTSHVNYPVIKTFKLAEQKGSYTPKPTREEYVSTIKGVFMLPVQQIILYLCMGSETSVTFRCIYVS